MQNPNDTSNPFELEKMKLQHASADLRTTLDAVRHYVQIGCEALVCVLAIAGAVYSAMQGYEHLSLVQGLVPSFWMVRNILK